MLPPPRLLTHWGYLDRASLGIPSPKGAGGIQGGGFALIRDVPPASLLRSGADLPSLTLSREARAAWLHPAQMPISRIASVPQFTLAGKMDCNTSDWDDIFDCSIGLPASNCGLEFSQNYSSSPAYRNQVS